MKTKLVEENVTTTEGILQDVCTIIDSARKDAHKAVNTALVKRNWLIGKNNSRRRIKRES